MVLANLTTNLPNGVTNVGADDPLGSLSELDPTKNHIYFNDFNTFNAAEWDITVVEDGGGSATQTIKDEGGGVLRIQNDDGSVDRTLMQLKSEGFKFKSGKKLYFRFKTKLSNSFQGIVQIGLTTRTVVQTPTDGVYFRKIDNETFLRLHVRKDDIETVTDVMDELENTISDEFTFVYDGASKIEIWHEDHLEAVSSTVNLPDDEELALLFFIQNGTGQNQSIDCDYIFIANER